MAKRPVQTKSTTPEGRAAPDRAQPSARRANKRDLALALMRRRDGATIEELTGATGWLPHSTRAVISGMRKDGIIIVRSMRDGMSCYTITEGAE